VFVSSSLHSAALGGLSGADDVCGDLASSAGLDGSFKAWLSSIAEPAADRLTHSDLPYALTDGTKLADDWDDLIDGSLNAPINLDENARLLSGDVWTGTLADGSPWLPDDCAGFSVGDSSQNAACGSATAQNSAWTDSQRPPCSAQLRLYCFEQ
jgi:hypothetical protein